MKLIYNNNCAENRSRVFGRIRLDQIEHVHQKALDEIYAIDGVVEAQYSCSIKFDLKVV